MKCSNCGHRGVYPVHQQYRDHVDDPSKAYFPQTWWVRASGHTWKEMRPYVCLNCGNVRAVATGKTESARKEVYNV